MAIDDDYIFGKAMLSTNHALQRQRGHLHVPAPPHRLPDFPVTLAMIHNEPGAHPYSKQVLKDAIAFIEKEYGVKYDWDAPCLTGPPT